MYDSPTTGKPFYILLDVLYEENHYSKLVSRPIKNDLLIIENQAEKVSIPSIDCILGDKLTAFAPHTTGIKFGIGKELEIVKQMYDVASLIEECDDFQDIRGSFEATACAEIAYRGEAISPQDVLKDAMEAAICIASKGMINSKEYKYYLDGIKGIINFIFCRAFLGRKSCFTCM